MKKREPGIKAKIFAERLNAGPLSDAEASELEAWLSENPDNSAEYRTALELLPEDGHSTADDDENTEDGFYTVSVAKPASKGHRLRILSAAFLFGVLVASVVLLNRAPTPDQPSVPYYQTAIGERQDVSLPDGSSVTLNTNSRILVDFTDNRRKVILDRGEVFFDVQPNKKRPFTVDVGSRTVTVLGTKFNVQLFPDELTVSVVEGSVALHERNEQLLASDVFFDQPEQSNNGEEDTGRYRLDAGIQMTVSLGRSQYTAATTGNVDQFDSWRNGVLVFDDQPLRKVVRDINRYDERSIVIDDPTIEELKFSGVFQIERTDSILTALAAVLPIQIDEANGRVTLSGDQEG